MKRIRVNLEPENQSRVPLIGQKIKLREWDIGGRPQHPEWTVTAWENDPNASWVVRTTDDGDEAYPLSFIVVLEEAA